jgi:hypothetical protein
VESPPTKVKPSPSADDPTGSEVNPTPTASIPDSAAVESTRSEVESPSTLPESTRADGDPDASAVQALHSSVVNEPYEAAFRCTKSSSPEPSTTIPPAHRNPKIAFCPLGSMKIVRNPLEALAF